jgi:hypothetical protein
VYELSEIGTVVLVSTKTDSLVFSINDTTQVDLYQLVAPSGLAGKLKLPKPNANPTPAQLDTILVGYGAQRRGAFGKVYTPSLTVLPDKTDVAFWGTSVLCPLPIT